MNKNGGRTEKTPSAWSLEIKRFKELCDQWLDYRLNKFFDLSVHGPPYRSLRISFLRVGFVIVVFIAYLLSYGFLAQIYSQQTTFSSLAIIAGLNLIRLLFILWIPVFIAIEMAGNYITDIFELKGPERCLEVHQRNIARRCQRGTSYSRWKSRGRRSGLAHRADRRAGPRRGRI